MSLRQKLFIALILAAILPLIGVAIFVLVAIHDFNEKNITQQLQQQLAANANLLSERIAARKLEIQALAQHPLIRRGDFPGSLPFLKHYLAIPNSPYEKFIIGDSNGHFYNTAGGNPYLGMLRSSDDESTEAKPKSIYHRDYWQHIVGSSNSEIPSVYVSNPMISYTTGVKQVVIAAPILNLNNQVIGLLGGAIPWSVFDQWLTEIEKSLVIPGDMPIRLLLTSHDGTYWHHWEQSKIIQPVQDPSGNSLLDELGEARVSKYNIKEEPNTKLQSIGQQMAQGKQGYEIVTGHANNDIWFYSPISSAGFAIALLVEEQQVNQLTKTVFLQVTAIFIAAIMLVSLLTIYLSEQLSYPIKRLAMRLKQVMRQELEFRDSIQDLVSDKETRKLVLACLNTLQSDKRSPKPDRDDDVIE